MDSCDTLFRHTTHSHWQNFLIFVPPNITCSESFPFHFGFFTPSFHIDCHCHFVSHNLHCTQLVHFDMSSLDNCVTSSEVHYIHIGQHFRIFVLPNIIFCESFSYIWAPFVPSFHNECPCNRLFQILVLSPAILTNVTIFSVVIM